MFCVISIENIKIKNLYSRLTLENQYFLQLFVDGWMYRWMRSLVHGLLTLSKDCPNNVFLQLSLYIHTWEMYHKLKYKWKFTKIPIPSSHCDADMPPIWWCIELRWWPPLIFPQLNWCTRVRCIGIPNWIFIFEKRYFLFAAVEFFGPNCSSKSLPLWEDGERHNCYGGA